MDKQQKKMLAAAYDLSARPAGVFRIVHRPSGKSFVGSTADLNAAWNRHRFQLVAGVHANAGLQKDWKESGEAAFEYEIMERFKKPENGQYNLAKELKRMEEEWIERISAYADQDGYHKRKS